MLQQAEEKGDTEKINSLRSLLVERVCEINPVTNVTGKGRNDFKLELLLRVEHILTRPILSTAVRRICEKVRKSFRLFRMLIRKYSENIEVVDPMLRNNEELVDVMGDFEQAWAQAKD